MKLHRLVLTNYRGIAHREIEFPDRGVVVVCGANEIGKSSMIEALDLLLESRDRSTKKEVKQVKPTHADVGSEVSAEISSGPYRFVYRKRFHKKSETELTVLAPRREQLTGDEAHERVRAMLAETVDNDLWHAQRVLQAASIAPVDLSGCDALSRALDVAAAQSDSVLSGTEPVLIERIDAEYARYFTATGRATGEWAARNRPTGRSRGAGQGVRGRGRRGRRPRASPCHSHRAGGRAVATAARRRASARRRRGGRRKGRPHLSGRHAKPSWSLTPPPRPTPLRPPPTPGGCGWSPKSTRVQRLSLRSRPRRKRPSTRSRRRAPTPRRPTKRSRKPPESSRAAQRRVEFTRLTARLDRIDTIQRDRDRIGAELSAITLTEALLQRIEKAAATVDRTSDQLALISAAVELTAAADIELAVGDQRVSVPAGQSWTTTVTGATEVEVVGVVTARVIPGATTLDVRAKHVAAQEELAAALGCRRGRRPCGGTRDRPAAPRTAKQPRPVGRDPGRPVRRRAGGPIARTTRAAVCRWPGRHRSRRSGQPNA